MRFRRNYHIAKRCKLGKIDKLIEHYPKQYSTPKYLTFIKEMLEAGHLVKIYEAGVSKYVFIQTEDELYKVRFSNHKPIYSKEIEEDCDYYVGISHRNVLTTQEIINLINYKPE